MSDDQRTASGLVTPCGGRLVNLLAPVGQRDGLIERAKHLPSLQISFRSVCDLELMATGAFSPLDRFMGERDYRSVLRDMRKADGTLMPIPITLPADDVEGLTIGQDIVLRSPTNEMLAIMRLEEVYPWDLHAETTAVLGTTDSRHPLVSEMYSWGRFYLSGPLTVLDLPRHRDFPALRRTPSEVRGVLDTMGRANVVAYQPRHPMHRAHETLTKSAADEVDGTLLIQPVAGITGFDDREHYTRVRCYETLVKKYYDAARTLLNLVPLAVRMSGPRAGLWHGIMNRNYGANHFIIGRDPHGPGLDSEGRSFYASRDVQEIFRAHEAEIGVRMIPNREMVYLPGGNRYEESCHVVKGTEAYIRVSATNVIEDFLFRGLQMPEWFTHPEIARILEDAHPPRTRQGFCVWLTGLPSSGKSTIAEALAPMLLMSGRRVTVLDGDIVRTHLTKGLGFGKEDRITNILRVGFVAAEVVRHEGVVICALISPYASARDQVRAMVGSDRFIEVFVDTPADVCRIRDVKGMYTMATQGRIKGFTGVDDGYESPRSPEVCIDTVSATPEESASQVLKLLAGKGFLALREKACEEALAANAISPSFQELKTASPEKSIRGDVRGNASAPIYSFMQEVPVMEEEKGNGSHGSLSRPRPVLMIPLRRCGSHALRLRLNCSPEFYAPYPLHIVDFMSLVKSYGDLSDDRSYFQLVMDVIGLETASMVKWPDVVFDPVEIFERIRKEPRSVHRVVWELLFQAGAKKGARVVMDKSLDSVHYAGEFMELFDDILFLNVVRDPRAQISSMNRAIIHDFHSLLNAMTWVKAHQAAKELALKYPDRVLTVRYEDFVSNQEEVLRRICGFFGIAFLPSMLDISRSEEARKISRLSALWETNNNAPIPANVNKFRKTLSAEEIEIIETVTGEYMDYYGYERMTPGNAQITPRIIEDAKRMSETNRKNAWDDLERNDIRDFQLRTFRRDYLEMVKERLARCGEKSQKLVDPAVIMRKSLQVCVSNGTDDGRPVAGNVPEELPVQVCRKEGHDLEKKPLA